MLRRLTGVAMIALVLSGGPVWADPAGGSMNSVPVSNDVPPPPPPPPPPAEAQQVIATGSDNSFTVSVNLEKSQGETGARRGVGHAPGVNAPTDQTAFVMPEAVPGWECVRVPGQDWGMCTWVGIDPASPGPEPAAPVVDRGRVESYVREVVGSIALPEPMIRVGPDPSVNKWDMAVVGFPLWFWTDSEDSVARTVSEYGITIELSARRDRVVFDFGDGTSLTCTAMASLPSNYDAGDPSPNCGHVYEVPSLPKGDYTVMATGYWTFTWSALGFSGTLPGQVSATRELPVGELQAVLVPVEG